jgi:hypothetical protein
MATGTNDKGFGREGELRRRGSGESATRTLGAGTTAGRHLHAGEGEPQLSKTIGCRLGGAPEVSSRATLSARAP